MGFVKASEIALFLNADLYGNTELQITKVAGLDEIDENCFSYANDKSVKVEQTDCLVLVSDNVQTDGLKCTFIKVENPRLAFAKVLQTFFVTGSTSGISKSAIILNNCNIHSSVSIGVNSSIGNNVRIGAGTIINNNVVIHDNTEIGSNCFIKSGSIIGEDGFGFAFEPDGTPVRIPHIGNVIIGNNVEIGANNTIARGTLSSTILKDGVKTDDQVHIAHNCQIGCNTVITACSEISGSVIIGENCWIGPNSSIMQKVNIADNVTVGIGSVVTKDISRYKKVMGLESLPLKKLISLKKSINWSDL